MSMDDVLTQPLTQLVSEVGSGRLKATTLVEGYLKRIDALDPRLHAMITVAAESALHEAALCDQEAGAGRLRGPLHGMPIAVKDSIDTAGIRTTGNSRLFEHVVPAEDATAVARLKAAGAIIIGKTNLNELGFSLPSEEDLVPPTQSPWRPDLRQVGSSSGSGAAVAAGMCAAALGTDGGGSIRLPAGQAGLVGLKVTRGRVSQRGSKGGTVGGIGPLGRTVADAALLLEVIAGYDPQDPASVDVPVPPYSQQLRRDISGIRIGVPRRYIETIPVEPEVLAAYDSALEALKGLGATLVDVEIPDLKVARAANFIVLNAENFPHYERYLRNDFHLFGPSARLYQLLGVFVSATDYQYALKVLDLTRKTVDDVLAPVDVLAMPTSPVVTAEAARRPGEHRKGINASFTAPFNLTGHPAISVPCGMSEVGMPMGLQLSGKDFDELTLLQVAYAYEQATNWHKLRPAI